ncbi:hypothetical protein XBKQ1_400043 [Xenorhabdus bovienii str. kraussei Quebec]|uniref:Uncharacterized protein n=1 Tax=Xenorhabdus bovienii str. kraussei Quebec TaxID=1398203 RepID=A0A077PNH7_XENBV|nr:hypothetical protein XBKQ1_400043 [Xenorhabdus bovienii str. kraussei Quebec]
MERVHYISLLFEILSVSRLKAQYNNEKECSHDSSNPYSILSGGRMRTDNE